MDKRVGIFIVFIVCLCVCISISVGVGIYVNQQETTDYSKSSLSITGTGTTQEPKVTFEPLFETLNLPKLPIENLVFRTAFVNNVTPIRVLHNGSLIRLSDKTTNDSIKEIHTTRWTFENNSLFAHEIDSYGHKLKDKSILYQEDPDKLTSLKVLSTKSPKYNEIPKLKLDLILRKSNGKYYIRNSKNEYLVGNGESLYFSTSTSLFTLLEGTIIEPVKLEHSTVDIEVDSNAETVQKNNKVYRKVTNSTFGNNYLLRFDEKTTDCYYIFRGRIGRTSSCADTDFYKISFKNVNGNLKILKNVHYANNVNNVITPSTSDNGSIYDVYKGPGKEFIIRLKGNDLYWTFAGKRSPASITLTATPTDIYFEQLKE